jgi:uncharacterized membrane protein YphA (DoxX/SURF4 family)
MKDFFKNETFRKTVVVVFRVLLGAVFIFSGFSKAIDPYGGYYKIVEYLEHFGMDFLVPIGFVFSVGLDALEFLLGMSLLLGANIRSTSILTVLFMLFMTPLTLYIAIANPVKDCGCFGDALVISNWETFWKNIVLLAMAITVCAWKKYSPKLYSQRTEWVIAIYSGFFSLFLSWYCYLNLPLIDFLPYKIGTDIEKSMEIPEGAPADKYETILVYEKDGEKREFTIDNWPKDDPSWVHDTTISKLVEKGYEPPITDFSISNNEEGDITDDVIYDPGYTFLLISTKVDKASTSKRNEINAIYDYARENGYKFYALTSTVLDSKELREYIVESGGAEYPFFNTDETQLKSMIRSNPGLMLIKDGVIIKKWSNMNMPVFEQPLEDSESGQLEMPNHILIIFITTIAFFIPLLLILLLDYGIGIIRRKQEN